MDALTIFPYGTQYDDGWANLPVVWWFWIAVLVLFGVSLWWSWFAPRIFRGIFGEADD